jgi:drug/metabolite transporter (DMT)-like permease
MKKGIYLVIITAIISGFANFFNKFGMQALGKDAFQYTTLKNVIVALVLSLLVLTPYLLPKLKKLTKKQWGQLVLIGLVGGSIPFLLFFKGLSLTSSVSASFIHKTLFIWVAILAWPILKEKMTKLQFLALGLLLFGNVIFESFRGLSWSYAETLILLATLLWAIETVMVKKVLANVDSTVLAWGRMFFGAIFLFGFLLVTGNMTNLSTLNSGQLSWLFLASGLLTGYVMTWYSALKKLPATVVTCFLVIASPITTFLNAAFVSHKLSNQNIFGAAVILFGMVIFWQINSSRLAQRNNLALNNN